MAATSTLSSRLAHLSLPRRGGGTLEVDAVQVGMILRFGYPARGQHGGAPQGIIVARKGRVTARLSGARLQIQQFEPRRARGVFSLASMTNVEIVLSGARRRGA